MVKTSDFESENSGSSPGEAAKFLKMLRDGEDYWQFPLTPQRAAELISEKFSELSADRRVALREMIEQWGHAWGSAVSSASAECGER